MLGAGACRRFKARRMECSSDILYILGPWPLWEEITTNIKRPRISGYDTTSALRLRRKRWPNYVALRDGMDYSPLGGYGTIFPRIISCSRTEIVTS